MKRTPHIIMREIAINDLKIALCDMVNQFAYGDEKQIYDGGLSALERAFTELNIETRTYSRKKLIKMWMEYEKDNEKLIEEMKGKLQIWSD